MDDDFLIDFGNVPEVYADGIARIIVTGPNAKLLLFSYQEIAGVLQRVAIMTLIRPIETLVGQDEVRQRVEAARLQFLRPMLRLH